MTLDGPRKNDPWFQLAFRYGTMCDLHVTIFILWENNEVKGQKVKKQKFDPYSRTEGNKRKNIGLYN